MPVYERVYKIVMQIPKGRVLTYGLISDLLGSRLSAQGVGWALKALPSASGKKSSQAASLYNGKTVPWHRVINSQGGTSTHKVAEIPPDLQRQLLEAEGVVFGLDERIDLPKYLWMEGLCDSVRNDKQPEKPDKAKPATKITVKAKPKSAGKDKFKL